MTAISHKNSVWASNRSVALRTFYRQILSEESWGLIAASSQRERIRRDPAYIQGFQGCLNAKLGVQKEKGAKSRGSNAS